MQEPSEDGLGGNKVRSTLWDTPTGYGWLSIALHWATAVVVVALLYTGGLSQIADGPERYASLTRAHMTMALCAYLVLWFRIVWRLAVGHPGPGPGHARLMFRFAKVLHTLIVVALAAMLLSGPLMVWARGDEIALFGAGIPGPMRSSTAAFSAFRYIHGLGASFLYLAVFLHVAAVVLHLAIVRDGSFDRIMVADHRNSGPKASR